MLIAHDRFDSVVEQLVPEKLGIRQILSQVNAMHHAS
jgi:hypothetical protein